MVCGLMGKWEVSLGPGDPGQTRDKRRPGVTGQFGRRKQRDGKAVEGGLQRLLCRSE